jgi:hypothetical protein
MKTKNLTNPLLTIIAFLLSAILIRSLLDSSPSHAQSQSGPFELYIEPGVQMLRAPDGSRQVLGKVVVDLHNGNIWGFPTTTEQPYPIDVMKQKPPTSTPFRLGRFDFSTMNGQ